MSSVGPYLRELRERRGVSLEEISRTTRVGRPYLGALEASDFSKLPAPVFTRGFILAYCQALGESPEEALARYSGRADAADEPVPHAAAERERDAARGRGPVLVSFILLVVLGVALFAVALVLQSGREGSERTARMETPDVARVDSRREMTPAAPTSSVAAATVDAEPPPITTEPPVASAAAPAVSKDAGMPPSSTPHAPTLTQQDVTAVVGGVSSPYRLIARTTAPTWMRVRTGDGRQSDETIPAGQVREWVSNRPFTVSIGNAGGVKLELNGRELPTLGASGAVIPRLVLPAEAS